MKENNDSPRPQLEIEFAEEGKDESNESADPTFEPLLTMESIDEGKEPDCLVVDDQAMLLFCVMGTLNVLNINCIGKLSGKEALECVKKRTDR